MAGTGVSAKAEGAASEPPLRVLTWSAAQLGLRLGVLLGLGLGRDALAVGVGLVGVRAVLGLERCGVGRALGLARLGGRDGRLLRGRGLGLGLGRDALAVRVVAALAGAVLRLEGGGVGG